MLKIELLISNVTAAPVPFVFGVVRSDRFYRHRLTMREYYTSVRPKFHRWSSYDSQLDKHHADINLAG